MNNSKEKEEVFDRYAMLKSKYPMAMILSLGYIEPTDYKKVENLTVESRNTILLIKDFLSIVISEAMKAKDRRDERKMTMFLRAAINMSNQFYANNPEDILFHALHPPIN